MKLNQHDHYIDTKEALKNLTDAYFKTGDIKLKAMRDLLEDYLSGTEYTNREVMIGHVKEELKNEESKEI